MSTSDARWYLFADDSGDPGTRPGATPYFGYTVLGIERTAMPEFTEIRAKFRFQRQNFRETKTNRIFTDGYRRAFDLLTPMLKNGTLRIASSFILKDKYTGPWLKENSGIPRSSNMLRNYLMRKTIELVFQEESDLGSITFELIADRVGYNHGQLKNAYRYLRGDFTEAGPFPIPLVTDVTHADSIYVEGLQVADQIGRLASSIITNLESTASIRAEFGDLLRIQILLGSRSFTMNPDAEPGL